MYSGLLRGRALVTTVLSRSCCFLRRQILSDVPAETIQLFQYSFLCLKRSMWLRVPAEPDFVMTCHAPKFLMLSRKLGREENEIHIQGMLLLLQKLFYFSQLLICSKSTAIFDQQNCNGGIEHLTGEMLSLCWIDEDREPYVLLQCLCPECWWKWTAKVIIIFVRFTFTS